MDVHTNLATLFFPTEHRTRLGILSCFLIAPYLSTVPSKTWNSTTKLTHGLKYLLINKLIHFNSCNLEISSSVPENAQLGSVAWFWCRQQLRHWKPAHDLFAWTQQFPRCDTQIRSIKCFIGISHQSYSEDCPIRF